MSILNIPKFSSTNSKFQNAPSTLWTAHSPMQKVVHCGSSDLILYQGVPFKWKWQKISKKQQKYFKRLLGLPEGDSKSLGFTPAEEVAFWNVCSHISEKEKWIFRFKKKHPKGWKKEKKTKNLKFGVESYLYPNFGVNLLVSEKTRFTDGWKYCDGGRQMPVQRD